MISCRHLKRTVCRVLSAAAILGLLLSPAQAVRAGQGSLSSLWAVESEHGTLFLLGSIHMLRSHDYPLSGAIEKAYAKSGTVVFETDLAAMSDPAMQASIVSLGIYPQGRSLGQAISGETYELLKKKVVSLGLPMAHFDRFRPWVCAQMLTVLEAQRLGYDLNFGVDLHFFSRALGDSKKTAFLESPDFQIGLMADMDPADQESFLRQTLKDLEVINEMLDVMTSAWKTGDEDRLEPVLNESFRGYPRIHDRLIFQRNRQWVPRIEELMRRGGNVLVIVGVGHLIGPKGVPSLLKEKGYRVEQR